MSRKYKNSADVPTDVLCDRMDEIVKTITAGDHGVSLSRECTMRVPAELDRDADLVLSESSRRLRLLSAADKPCHRDKSDREEKERG